ncbi:MAG: hypothetical protein C0172_02035 [Caldisphaera sp.]|nr:MAG: hypothetical protein C0201_03120 [Caldisphaera sp.]PMP88670.1 MAG: hypothetical protein C0172_02035 [Caldisphaera sp.]
MANRSLNKKITYIIVLLMVVIVLTNALWFVSFSQINNSYNTIKNKYNQSVTTYNKTINNLTKIITTYQKDLNTTIKLLNISTKLLKIYNATLTIETAEYNLTKAKLNIAMALLTLNSIDEFKIANSSMQDAINLTLSSTQNSSLKSYYLIAASKDVNTSILILNQLETNGKILNLSRYYLNNISNALSLANSVNSIIIKLINGGSPSYTDIATLTNAQTYFPIYLAYAEKILLNNY